jgi:TetR/AcrR family fatty acid metabolism transcriptional regulator
MLHGRIVMLHGRIVMLHGRIAMRPYAPFCPLMNPWLILKRLPCKPTHAALTAFWLAVRVCIHTKLLERCGKAIPMKDTDQLSTARRKQILDAAERVFAAKGFHPTTIKDISREAGIADGTIYNYFENKNALILALIDRVNELNRSQFEALASLSIPDFRQFMVEFLRQRLQNIQRDNFALTRVVVSEILVNETLREQYHHTIMTPNFTAMEAIFRHWAHQQAIDISQIDLTIHAVSGMLLGIITQCMLGDEQLLAQWDSLPEYLTDFILRGLSV